MHWWPKLLVISEMHHQQTILMNASQAYAKPFTHE
jgi:hypothetical protein